MLQQFGHEEMVMSIAVDRKEGEMLITKHTASIFIGTDFERMVRNAGITTIVFTGISTELGVESSARDALNRDFYPVIVSDAASSSDKYTHSLLAEPAKISYCFGYTTQLADIVSKSR